MKSLREGNQFEILADLHYDQHDNVEKIRDMIT